MAMDVKINIWPTYGKINMAVKINIWPTPAIERFHFGFDAQKALGSFSIHPSLFHLKAKP